MSTPKSPVGNILLWCVAGLSLVLSSISFVRSFTEDKKVVSLDVVRLITEYKGINDMKRSNIARHKVLKANIDTLKAELQSSLDQYKTAGNKLSQKDLALLEQVIRVQEQNLSSYEQTVNTQIKRDEEELATELLNKVNDYVKKYGQENGYTIILASTQLGNVAYAEDKVDITDKVLQGLNRQYQAAK